MLANIIRTAKRTATGGTGGGIVTDGGDPYYSGVALLLPMDGTDGSTTFTDSGPNALTVNRSGNAQISTAQSKFGGASAYFSSTSDLVVATGNFSQPGDFTIECWFFVQNTTGNKIIFTVGNESTSRVALYLVGSVLNYDTYSTGQPDFATSGTVSANTWYHVALVRSGTTITVYLNGASVGTATSSSVIGNVNNIALGNTNPASLNFNGYIDDLRISRFARYTSAFTPPAAALPTYQSSTVADPYYGSTSLLLHMDGANASTSFVDSGPNALSVTATGSAVISTAQSKFGGASGYFDGSTAYLTQSSNIVQFGTADFTVEFWTRFSSGTGYRQVLGNATTASGIAFGTNNYSGSVKMYATTSTTGYPGTTVLSVDTWYHMAFVRQSGTLKLYLNGILDATYTVSTNFTESGGTIAAMPSGSNKFNGYIDDLRITKGVARFTSNFTPSTSAFPNA